MKQNVLEVGQVFKNNGREFKVRAISGDIAVVERLNFDLFGSIEYVVANHIRPSIFGEYDWAYGNYYYKLEDALNKAGLHMTLPKHGIKLQGYRDTWYIIGEQYILGEKYYLLENEVWGEEVPCIITNRCGDVIMSKVYDGFDDLREELGVLY